MVRFKIIKETYSNNVVLYRLKYRHPWFKRLWVYVGKNTDRLFFTKYNYHQTTFNSFEEAYNRYEEYKKYIKYVKAPFVINKRVCKELT